MKRSRYALALAVAGNLGAIAGLFVLAGDHGARLIVAAIFGLPLLVCLNGLLHARSYTAAWSAMLALFYLAYAMTEYIVGSATIGVIILLAACVAWFVGCVVFARWSAREQSAAARAPTQANTGQSHGVR